MLQFLTLLFRVFSTFVSHRNSTIKKISKDDRLINSCTRSSRKSVFWAGSSLVQMLKKDLSHAFDIKLYPITKKGIVNYPMVSIPDLKIYILVPERPVNLFTVVWKTAFAGLFNYIYGSHSFSG